MPRTGYKSITVPEELFNQLRSISSQKGVSIQQFLRNMIKEVGGLGNPGSRTAAALGGQVNGAEVKPECENSRRCEC